MRLKNLSRTHKIRVLAKLFAGVVNPLAAIQRRPTGGLSTWKDQELIDEYERWRQKEFQETGILPAPLPDYSAMSMEELEQRHQRIQIALYYAESGQ